MADGSHLPIELIEPGDEVLAYDENTDTWSGREVLDQWSHGDTGDMVTVTLDDGSSVSATDHHLFWEVNGNEWVEAENLEPGDLLADPDGSVTVADVTLWPEGYNLVWELTVDTDHTFTVHTGTADVVVHNASCYASPSPNNYLHGETDGGPGVWGADRLNTDSGAIFQQAVTGAPTGTGYRVPSTTSPTGTRVFDGYDSGREVLLDAKDWQIFLLPDESWWVSGRRSEMINQVIDAGGVQVEWVFSTPEARDAAEQVWLGILADIDANVFPDPDFLPDPDDILFVVFN